MKIRWKELIVAVLIPLAAGGLAAWITTDNMAMFDEIAKPPLAPPRWLFPVAWTILYILMGIASYLIYVSDAPKEQKSSSLTLYGIQLLLNFFWSIIFFNLRSYLFAFIWLVFLWIFILASLLSFKKTSKTAAYLMIPYLVWVTFAGYLNFGIYLLN